MQSLELIAWECSDRDPKPTSQCRCWNLPSECSRWSISWQSITFFHSVKDIWWVEVGFPLIPAQLTPISMCPKWSQLVIAWECSDRDPKPTSQCRCWNLPSECSRWSQQQTLLLWRYVGHILPEAPPVINAVPRTWQVMLSDTTQVRTEPGISVIRCRKVMGCHILWYSTLQ
jgi:hypothetical protein